MGQDRGWAEKSQIHWIVQGEGPDDFYLCGLQPDTHGGYFGLEMVYRIGRNPFQMRKNDD